MFQITQKKAVVARLIVPLLYVSGRVGAQSTVATFQLPEYFGVTWPTQNLEMRYDGGYPDSKTTRMANANGVEIPYQWISGAGCWDSTAVNGCILVQDGLAANTTSTYTLQSGIAPAASVTNPVTVIAGTCRGGMRGWIIANGLTGFCVPQTQSAPYNFAPIQGIQLSNGTWTGAAAGTPNLIYHNLVSGVWPGSSSVNGMAGGITTLMRTPATIFTGETTTFVDAGPLKTSVQLSYSANKPVYYNYAGAAVFGSTASTITINYLPGNFDCNTPIVYFLMNGPHPLPTPLRPNTPYYTSNCMVNGSMVTYSLSLSPGGSIISNIGPYQGQVGGVASGLNGSGAGHLTVTLSLYANRPAFAYDIDTDLSIQDFVPIYAEVQPDTRRYRGYGSTSSVCGYEIPLSITNVTNTTPPTVTVSSGLAASAGNQVTISGVNGATGINGTYYICNPSYTGNTFTLYSSASCSGSSPSAGGAYTSGGIAKAQYRSINNRGPEDAFYDISYARDYLPGNVCAAGTIPVLGINYPPAWIDEGYYDMVYSSSLGSAAPVIGLFEGRFAKLFNIAGNGQPGWFSSNNHWIPQYNATCSSGTCAFGIEHIIRVNTLAPTVHGNFGIFVGTVGRLGSPYATQPIMREQSVFQGINLSSLYTYKLDYPDPQPTDPPNYGWTWPYMKFSDFSNWVSLFQHSASFCASTGSCSGDDGYYTKMKASESSSGGIQDMWHYNDAAHAAAAYSQVLNSGAGGEFHGASSASWSGGTATLTIGQHNMSIGQLVAVSGFTPAAYNCNSCAITGVTTTTISYSVPSNPGSFVAPGYVWELGVQGFVNVLADGDNVWQASTAYYQLFLNQFGPDFPACAAIILNANATASQKNGCKRILALAASLIWDNDWFPIGGINGVGQTTSGDNGGLENQQVQYSQYRSQASSYLYFHPYLATKLPQATASTVGVYNTFANQFGVGQGSLHYQGTYTFPLYQAFQPLALSGNYAPISFTDGTYRWQQHVKWYLSGLTPPEPRFGTSRKCLSNGDGNTEAACAPYFGMIAEGLWASDPATAGAAIWGWAQTNSNSYSVDPNTVWLLNPLVPQVGPTLSSGNFPGYWSVARYGFGTPYETSVHFINGSFYSPQGHRHLDDGQVSIYAHSAPLAIDWNANLYNPETGASFCHNRIVLDSEISNFGAWSNDAPDCSSNNTTGPLLAANETNFSAFTKSTQSIATFTYQDGSVWKRAVRTIAANPVYPLIYVKDSFAGPSATAPKTLTWNLMATGSVVTPAGVVTPIVRYSGPPNAPTGCNSPAAQYPSNGTVYSLQNGLQQFTFTGASWPVHATRGIYWDLWEIPTSGSAQFLIGNWGHGCNTSREVAEFQAVNGIPFNERQHILRVHDTGTFQTLIAPYRPAESPTRTVSMQSCGIQIVQGTEVTCFDDSVLTYTNGATQILTVYDVSMQSAFGWTAVGGAQELVNNGSGTITWTIEDTVAGTRCVILPPNASLQNGAGVSYNAATGQYCYTQNASAQPTPVTVTFALN